MSANSSPQVLVEVAVDSVDGALAAAAAGAHRLELCADLAAGGLTPTPGLVEAVLRATPLPVVAMLRPRPGDFLYSAGEWAAVLGDLRWLARSGVAGLVTGALTAAGDLDRARLAAVRDAAGALPLCCHRAFDLCRDADAALDALLELGCQRVLTSGQAATAVQGQAAIAALVRRAGPRLAVLAGAGVRAANVAALVRATGVREVHLSATRWAPSPMQFRREAVPMGQALPPDEYQRRTTDGAEVAAVLAALQAAGPAG